MVKAIPVSCGKNSFTMERRKFFVDELLTSAFECEKKKLQFVVNYNTTPKTVNFAKICTLYKNPEMTEKEENVSTFVIPPLTAFALEY